MPDVAFVGDQKYTHGNTYRRSHARAEVFSGAECKDRVMSQAGESAVRRVVILGGGFAGVYTAKYLEHLCRRRTDIEIVLVNKENYFVFQPLLAEVVSGNIGILDTVSPIRRLLKRTRLFIREVDSVDLANRTVTLSPGFQPRAYTLPFDHLVVAMGSVTDFRNMPGLHEHALPFKNLADAIRLRNHLIHVLEEASIEPDTEFRRQLLTFVVAGGGFSGVEVCAELNDFVRHVGRQYSTIDPKQIRVVLIHTGERILERELPQSLSEYAQRKIQQRGVELLLKSRLKTATPGAAVLANGERIPTRTLVSTVPSSPNPLVESLDLPKQKGRIEVDEFLAVKGRENLWALGDCAVIPCGKDFAPPTAQHAVREAKIAAHNIFAALAGGTKKQFAFAGLGKMGSLGHHSAVAEMLGKFHLSGWPAWFLWRTVYWWKLPGIVRKTKLGVSWALDVLFPPETVQLKLAGSEGIAQSHFEPGEIIFKQGDLGDSLYILLSGQVEVVREDAGGEKVIAKLNAGDYFGEAALLNNRTRGATVRCASCVDVLAIRKEEFHTLAANLPELRKNFETVSQQRLEKLQQHIAEEHRQ